MDYLDLIYKVLLDRRFLLLLFIVNLLGTIYGFMWYESQLAITPTKFLLFVPDSPMASMFFTIFLLFFLFNRNLPYIEALALITLFKYGVWAVVMNLFTFYVNSSIDPVGLMLIASHAGMAIQALLYTPFYKIKLRHLTLAAIWTLHNDVIDYVFGMMPIYSDLTNYMKQIGYFTFWLSIVSILIAYFLTIQKNSAKL